MSAAPGRSPTSSRRSPQGEATPVTLLDTLLRWLPADSRVGVARRLGVVWTVAFLISGYQWLTGSQSGRFDVSLVYSYAISTCIWFLCDPFRIVLRRWYGISKGPHYWQHAPRIWLHIAVSVVLGYIAGTFIGDAYLGRSTWELFTISPQRFWGFWLSTVLLALGFTVYFNERGKAEELQRQATEARLKLLETQLEPHMLFNTLANLRVLIQTDPPRAVAMLDRLGDYLRATLRGSRTDAAAGTHTLADEFARLNDYLELMAVRMGPRLHHTFDVPDEMLPHPVPPLLLQPLVENAIRHGLEPQVEGGQITVHARRDGPHLLIEVTDTGVGMEPTALADAGGGFGLAQVRERVASLGSGKSTGQVQVLSKPGEGTTVRLKLPLQATSTP